MLSQVMLATAKPQMTRVKLNSSAESCPCQKYKPLVVGTVVEYSKVVASIKIMQLSVQVYCSKKYTPSKNKTTTKKTNTQHKVEGGE